MHHSFLSLPCLPFFIPSSPFLVCLFAAIKQSAKNAWNKVKAVGKKVKNAIFGTKKTLAKVPTAVAPTPKPATPAAPAPPKQPAPKEPKKEEPKATQFQPKTVSLTGGPNPLRKALDRVLAEEPDSAAIKKAKDNWRWEDVVLKRLDSYAPPDPRRLKKRLEKVREASGETCVTASDVCMQYPLNMHSCLTAKQACFESKVTVIRLQKAADVCIKAEEPCKRRDWQGQGECLVAKARCKKYLKYTAHSAVLAKKLSRTLRTLQIYDKEAAQARVAVKDGKVPLKAAQAKVKVLEKELKECIKSRTEAQKCEAKDDDVTPPCVKALKAAEECIGAEERLQEVRARALACN